MRLERWLHPTALLVLSFILVGTMWVVPYLPTNDGPEWIFATHAENHFSDPGAPYPDGLVPAPQFASRGMSLIYGPLEAWLGWQRGLQVALSLIVLLAAWGFVVLVRALNPERSAIALLGFPLALSWELYMGLWPFAVSTALGIYVVALAVSLRTPTLKGRVALALLLFVQAIAHVFGAVLSGGAILLLALTRTPRGRRLPEVLRVAMTGLPAASVLAACVWLAWVGPEAPFSRGFERVPWREALASFPRTVAPGSLGRALVVTAALLVATLVAGVRACRATTDPADRALGGAAVVLFLAAAFAPFQIPGWQAFSQRFVPLWATFAFAVLPLERLPLVAKRLVSALLFSAVTLSLGLTYPFHQRLAALCPDAIVGLGTSVRKKGDVLSVVLRQTEQPSYDRVRSEVPFMSPLIHMGTLYATVLGGIPASAFTGAIAIHAFTRLPGKRPPVDTEHYVKALSARAFSHDLAYRNDVENELATLGAFYDEVVVFGAIPSDYALWRARGYVVDWKGTTTMIGHFEACTIDVTVPLAAADPSPAFDVRAGGDVSAVVTGAHLPFVVGDDGLAHFALTPAPCGDVAVRARWETPPGAAAFCTNAGADGTIRVRVSRRSSVACERP